jgi:integrase
MPQLSGDFEARRRIDSRVDGRFRDLRAKAATDLGDLEWAQKLLGHSGREMTEHYTRKRAGKRVTPVRRRIIGEDWRIPSTAIGYSLRS